MKQLHYACAELKDKNEIAIIYKYGCDAKHYTTILTCKLIYFNIIPNIYSIQHILNKFIFK